MPKMSKTSNVTAKEDIVETATIESQSVEQSTENKEIEELKEQNKDLTNQLSQLMEMFQEMKTSFAKQADTKSELVTDKDKSDDIISRLHNEYDFSDIPPEVSPNKQISVMSLYYGSLNLKDGHGSTVLKFGKYGETRPVLYSTLMDVVNSNRTFAETGKFYILDKDAVYHLGLSEYYKNLIPKDIIDNVLDYSLNIIESIIKSIDSEQRDTLIRILIEKVYTGQPVDNNKIVFIGKLCDVDILEKANEAKRFDM